MALLTKLRDCIYRHYTFDDERSKSSAQIQAEQYLLCLPSPKDNDRFYYTSCIRFNRWYLFIASFVAQFCNGSLYAWSVYLNYIDEYVTGDPKAGKAVMAFYVACGVFGLSAALLGPWLETVGPRKAITVGATLFVVAHIGAGIAMYLKSMTWIYIMYGVIGGCGNGICYISPVSTLQKWFPDLRGTAAGFAVSGFGAGPMLWAIVFPYPIQVLKTPVYSSFMWFGAIIGAILYLCAIVMRTPPPGYTVGGLDMHGINPKRAKLIYGESPHQFPDGNVILFLHEDLMRSTTQEVIAFQHPQEYYRESELDDTELFYFLRVKNLQLVNCVFSIDFTFLWVMFFLQSVFGLVVISRLHDMDLYLFAPNSNNITDDDIDRANRMVSCNAIFNFGGRLAWPVLSDIIIRIFYLNPATGRKLIFLINLSLQLGIALCLNSVIRDQNHNFFQALVWTLTFVYGGGFGTIPCLLCDMFGANNVGALHGIILTSWAIAGVGGGLGFTNIFDNALRHNSIATAYSSATLLFIIVISAGLVVLFFVRTNPVDRFAPGYQYSIGRFRICHFKRPLIEDYMGVTH